MKAATALAVSRADVDRALRTGDLLAEIEATRQAKSHVGRPPARKVKVISATPTVSRPTQRRMTRSSVREWAPKCLARGSDERSMGYDVRGFRHWAARLAKPPVFGQAVLALNRQQFTSSRSAILHKA